MSDATSPYGRKTQTDPAVAEIDVLWITAGLGCDGDTVSITAASQPSIEDALRGKSPTEAREELLQRFRAKGIEPDEDAIEALVRLHTAATGSLLLRSSWSFSSRLSQRRPRGASPSASPTSCDSSAMASTSRPSRA